MQATKYTEEVLTEAVKVSYSIAGVLRHLGVKQAGGTQAYISKRIAQFGIDCSHFTRQAHNKGKVSTRRKPAEEILVIRPEGSHRTHRPQLLRAMLEVGIPEICNECGLNPEWNGKKLTLEINHIDGNWLDSRAENVEFLCPNCHSQDKNTNLPHKYRGR
jgi:hypothetical protein